MSIVIDRNVLPDEPFFFQAPSFTLATPMTGSRALKELRKGLKRRSLLDEWW